MSNIGTLIEKSPQLIDQVGKCFKGSLKCSHSGRKRHASHG